MFEFKKRISCRSHLLATSASIILGLLCCGYVAASDKPKVSAFYDQVEELVKKYYPQAEFEQKEAEKQFLARYKTRQFMIHHALKTGEWQEAMPQEGPNRHGIRLSMQAYPGQWMGAAVLPQTFSYRYFTSLIAAPYNSKLNMHVHCTLDYPADANPEFLKSYQSLLAEFSKEKN